MFYGKEDWILERKMGTLSKEKAQKRRKLLQEMMKAVAFYEAKSKITKNAGKQSSNRKSALPKEKTEKINEQKKSGRKKTEDKSDALKSKFQLTEEEKSALDDIVKQIHHQDVNVKAVKKEKKRENVARKKDYYSGEMREVTYNEEETDTLENRFFNFDADFDAGMLWDDTNLDDYSDLFTARELNILKEKQRQLKNGTFRLDNLQSDSFYNLMGDFEISEDDYEEDEDIEDIVSEDDFLEELKISEDDFE